MGQPAVKELLARLDELKAEAAALEEDVEKIRAEVPDGESGQGDKADKAV